MSIYWIYTIGFLKIIRRILNYMRNPSLQPLFDVLCEL